MQVLLDLASDLGSWSRIFPDFSCASTINIQISTAGAQGGPVFLEVKPTCHILHIISKKIHLKSQFIHSRL